MTLMQLFWLASLFCLTLYLRNLERRLRGLEKVMLPHGGRLVATIVEESNDAN